MVEAKAEKNSKEKVGDGSIKVKKKIFYELMNPTPPNPR